MNFLTINNVETSPSVFEDVDLSDYIKAYQVDYVDIEDSSSGRNAKGVLCRDVIRTVRVINCTFRVSKQTEQELIMQATSEKSLDITYYDTATGVDTETMTVYASPTRSNNIYNAGNGVIYNEFAITFSEF